MALSSAQRVALYRQCYHELDGRRAEEADPRAAAALEAEIRCLEELIVLATELGSKCLPRRDDPWAGQPQAKPRRRECVGAAAEAMPARDGLDLSLVTDLLMLSASSPWTVYVAERSQQWQVRYVSPSVRRILGWAPQDMVGAAAWAGCHLDDVPKLQQMLQAQDSCGGARPEQQNLCFRRLRKDGTYAAVQATGRALGSRWFAWVELATADDAGGLPPHSLLVLSPNEAEEDSDHEQAGLRQAASSPRSRSSYWPPRQASPPSTAVPSKPSDLVELQKRPSFRWGASSDVAEAAAPESMSRGALRSQAGACSIAIRHSDLGAMAMPDINSVRTPAPPPTKPAGKLVRTGGPMGLSSVASGGLTEWSEARTFHGCGEKVVAAGHEHGGTMSDGHISPDKGQLKRDLGRIEEQHLADCLEMAMGRAPSVSPDAKLCRGGGSGDLASCAKGIKACSISAGGPPEYASNEVMDVMYLEVPEKPSSAAALRAASKAAALEQGHAAADYRSPRQPKVTSDVSPPPHTQVAAPDGDGGGSQHAPLRKQDSLLVGQGQRASGNSPRPPSRDKDDSRGGYGEALAEKGGTAKRQLRPHGGGRLVGPSLQRHSLSQISEEQLRLIRDRKVLLVEDNVVNRTMGQRLLESLDCEVTVACNGLEALEILQAASGDADGASSPPQFDLVLMDLEMPVMDGRRAVASYRQWEEEHQEVERDTERRKQTLIFAITASATDGEMMKCAQSGFDEFVSKPLTAEKLCHRMEERSKRCQTA
eukprot:SM000110S18886  [mRNA]  locus=s110:132515:136658:+ [translate_table: standard]